MKRVGKCMVTNCPCKKFKPQESYTPERFIRKLWKPQSPQESISEKKFLIMKPVDTQSPQTKPETISAMTGDIPLNTEILKDKTVDTQNPQTKQEKLIRVQVLQSGKALEEITLPYKKKFVKIISKWMENKP